jgi:hypothetical protein
VDDYYLDQEYTDASRDAWNEFDKEDREGYFSIKILE